jgi:hypothetical protein
MRISARPGGKGVLMSGGPLKPKFLLVVSLSCLLPAAPCFSQARHLKTAQPTTQDQTAQNAAAAPPPTLAQLPATPPQVSFQDGQLTISAQNSTLGDILKAVRTQTGATIDLPGNAPERVVGQFGPAPARDVLASLLNGSHFNYLLLGSPTDPAALDRVILMAKSGGPAQSSPEPSSQPENPPAQIAYPRPMAPMSAPGSSTVTVEGQDADDSSDDADADSSDDSADDSTDQTEDDQAATDDQQQTQQDGQQQVKTPEQLLQELQQRQQQLQQQGAQPGVPPGIRQFPNPGGAPGQPGGAPASPPQN